ncbi:hypothetical protein HMSP1_28 [Sinorhizobium phage HMSP1-Susan]|nr:hypothetical protein HMSP1_28 [Sinorhizobium phage HMSP1-Susan]
MHNEFLWLERLVFWVAVGGTVAIFTSGVISGLIIASLNN